MTRAGRALIGAAVGAAATLLLHPISRSYPLSAFLVPAPRSVPILGHPNTREVAAEWMLAVGDRFMARSPLTQKETANAIDAATQAIELEPDNAYWHQMLAAMNHLSGHEQEASRQWAIAAACAQWNDYQTPTLLKESNRLALDFGSAQSWQLAFAYYQRNENAVQLIVSYSRALLAKEPLSSREGLLMRARCVLNGAHIQQQGRSIRIGRLGGGMMEAASHPADQFLAGSHRKLTLARMAMYNRLREIGQFDLAEQINKAYRDSDAWNAYENPDDAAEQVASLSALSILYVGLPTMFVVAGVVGLGLWLLGHALRKLRHIDVVPSAIAGTILAVAAYASTLLPLTAVTTFLCCLFLTISPSRERKLRIDDLGPMFGFSVVTLALVFLALLGAFVVGTSAPAVAVLSEIGVPREFFGGSGVMLGLALIVLALLVLLAPLFAIALRVATPFVLSITLRKCGSFMGVLSLVGIVLGTPACIYLDRQNENALQRIVSNEPVYYLSLPQ